MIEVKVCGLTRREDIEAALEAGADYVGIHLDPDSPRAVPMAEAAALADFADGLGLKAIAVMSDPDDDVLEALAKATGFRFAQLNGAESPQRAERVGQITHLRVVKSLSAATPAELARRGLYDEVDCFLFNPKGEYGILRGARVARPWFLAGGLTPDNVTDAVHASGALMVEVTTGVESAPGVKDPGLMRAFVEAAQKGECA